jgi:thymidine phosphorylase
MSKKLAEGSNALLLDVKCGSGAFMKTLDGARALAEAMVDIGTRSGVRTEALVTDMDAPLGRAVGNALEIVECLETLKGRGPQALREVVRRIGARMLILGGAERESAAAAARVDAALASGAALQTFARMVEAHGGDPRIVDDDALLPSAPGRELVRAPRAGFIASVAAEPIGRASNALGAGRTTVGDAVDHAAGILVLVSPGDEVQAGDPVLELHHRDGRGLDAALALCRGAVTVADERPKPRPKILAEIA